LFHDVKTAVIIFICPAAATIIGDRAFAVAGPRAWNNLPDFITDCSSSLTFKQYVINPKHSLPWVGGEVKSVLPSAIRECLSSHCGQAWHWSDTGDLSYVVCAFRVNIIQWWNLKFSTFRRGRQTMAAWCVEWTAETAVSVLTLWRPLLPRGYSY